MRLLVKWREDEERVDWLLESLPADMPAGERARVQALLVGTVRHLGRIDGHLDALMTRPPRPTVWAGLAVAGFELLEGGADEGLKARVCHHLVEQVKRLATAKEAGFANAVVRKLAAALAADVEPAADAPMADWARWGSHPDWLVQRWKMKFNQDAAVAFLRWNQSAAPVLVRWRGEAAAKAELPEWLTPIEGAPDFFSAEPGHWPELAAWIERGEMQVQDAATRHAVDLLQVQPGETVLDLCAAPGGKSLAIADRLGGSGQVVAMDLPGRRMPRLQRNLEAAPSGVKATVVAGNVMQGAARVLTAKNLPTTYAAVLLDVPCSNTGVMRHRVDVKWRLQPDSFRRHAIQQLDMLLAAAERVAPGGRLVYSTCSVDPEENEQVVAAFVRRSHGAFKLEESVMSLPWETGHDGAGAFRLRRV
ncbi:RsmB/NOP family class I SAM-dependent RNA methyltransferase [Actomonas aquatica]|uniref:RsmB/NOP family class I SAM-dependent RNA methyltransferase n=1 Tax=Actomonas aquatica TaxID=2866162 RepID=A0ABZ1CAP0_9BACT|nr:RsmB/NOP family class I SAM-dependent RNA methyltransferase [Opitutus sp. WL0086]WRQ88705.1 RsmB/NOP family class I SAM-dependent RNA methyltransferase [Opitutus sp. WL0086]